ncbi:phosphogluconate dehydrogenase C-terminal domain-containing protein [Orrella sp. JC864]|uniref:phosphogluconate dehydrogenase C-terminal domain-containing protein n=1 Tax=Orrella sp. JC864 TaxID=3120298 RepID=UPI003008DD0B
MMTRIAVVGAGGKMGCRVSANLKASPWQVEHIEVSQAGRERLQALDIQCVPAEEALPRADVVILAIPDNLIGKITAQQTPLYRQGAMLIALDAAAPFAGELPGREDLTIFVAHPCHPPLFNDETSAAAKADYFGGVAAKQHIVCSLMRGPDAHYALGEQVARQMYAPVMRSHRVTVEQMAILEPVLSETIGATCIAIMREATDEAVRRGVPEQAAHDFILGHMTVLTAMQFGLMGPGARMSDAAIKAVEIAKKELFAPDWKKVFEPAAVAASIRMITAP